MADTQATEYCTWCFSIMAHTRANQTYPYVVPIMIDKKCILSENIFSQLIFVLMDKYMQIRY